MNKSQLFLSSLMLLLLLISGFLMVFSKEPGYEDVYYMREDANNAILKKSGVNLLWNYTTGNNVNSVAISSNGEYITAGSDDNNTYLFDISSNIPLWSYPAEGGITAVAISSGGDYFTVGSTDNQVYLFRWTPTIAIDEDDKKLDIDFGENAIPFGNYYLPITLISVLVLILIKRKKLSSKNKI